VPCFLRPFFRDFLLSLVTVDADLDSEAVVASTSGTSTNGKAKSSKRRQSSSDDDDDDTTPDASLSGDNASSTDSESKSSAEPPAVPKRLRTQRSAKQKLLSKMSTRGRGRGNFCSVLTLLHRFEALLCADVPS